MSISKATAAAINNRNSIEIKPTTPTHRRLSSTKSCKSASITDLISRTFVKAHNTGEVSVQVLEGDFSSDKPLDLYCVLRIGVQPHNQKQRVNRKYSKTAVQYKSVSPVWNHSITLDVDNKADDKLLVKVKDYVRLGKDREIGRVVIPVSTWEEDSGSLDLWYTLENESTKVKEGKIKLRVTYVSAMRLSKDFSLATTNFEYLVNFLLDDSFYMVNALSEICKDTDLALAIIRIFNASGQAQNLIGCLITREIKRHYNADRDLNTLFRTDSPATRIIREYFHLISKWGYLKKYIKPTIEDIIANLEKGVNFELAESAENMKEIANKLINSLLGSAEHIPSNMKKTFVLLAQLLKETHCYTSVFPATNLLFLRFLCPNVLFPTQLGLIQNTVPNLSRPCLLLAKILQNVASCCVFNEEDQAMLVYNPIIEAHSTAISAFLKNICDSNDKHTTGPADDFRPTYSPEDLVKLMTIITRRIHDNMGELKIACATDPECTVTIKAHIEKFAHLVEEQAK